MTSARIMGGLARECDQAIAALIKDLKQRGMLDDTLVIWGGEFGRTPTVELPDLGANSGMVNGRDHNPYGFTMWLAAQGVKKGLVYGATDEFGFAAVENKVHVHDLHATLLHLLGFDHEKFTYRYAGRDFRLTDVHGEVVRDPASRDGALIWASQRIRNGFLKERLACMLAVSRHRVMARLAVSLCVVSE